jgi:hypothetical protein
MKKKRNEVWTERNITFSAMNCHKKYQNRILEHQQKMCSMSARRLSIQETYKIYEKNI